MLSTGQIRAALAQNAFVSAVDYFPCIGSTNNWAKAQASAGAAEGLLVIADQQTAGRGRLGRSWWSPPGTALLTSLLFRPATLPATRVQQLTMLCALAAADAASTHTGLSVGIKWPNDLVVDGRKLAGLLAEAAFSGERLDFVVVGLGINVNTDFSCAPALMAPATSLRQETGRPLDRLALLATYLENVAQRYRRLCEGHSPFEDWADRLVTLGQPVTAQRVGEERALAGWAEAVDPTGALLLRTADRMVHRLLAADVSLRGGETSAGAMKS